MRNILQRNKRSPIALDIGTDSVKMLQIQWVGSQTSAFACGRWSFPSETELAPQRRRELTVTAVKELLRTGGFHGRRCITALSCEDLGIKNIRIPAMPDHELAQAVMWEAVERLDFQTGQDHLNFLRAGQVRTGTETREEVIMLTASQKVVEDHIEMIDEMGLKPENIDAEPLALFRGFERFLRRRADENAVSVVVDIGLGSTRVVIARGRHIVFIKKIDIGGRKLSEAVAKQLNLSFKEASDLRRRTMQENGDAMEGGRDDASSANRNDVGWTIHDAVRGEVEELAREIGLCLRYCSVTFRGLRPDSVIITGGEAYDPALVQLLKEQLSLDCKVGSPLRGFDLSSVDLGSNRRGVLSEWSICAGLVLRYAGKELKTEKADHGERRLSA